MNFNTQVYMYIVLHFISDSYCYDRISRGSTYTGTKTTTISGRTCLNWRSVNSPYVMFHENHNNCRNPNGDLIKPWCYTEAKSYRFEFCNVPICGTIFHICPIWDMHKHINDISTHTTKSPLIIVNIGRLYMHPIFHVLGPLDFALI